MCKPFVSTFAYIDMYTTLNFVSIVGYTTLYYDVSERGWLFLVLSSIGFYMYTDTFAYYLHRLFHYPYLYKKIHKVHHRYHQPTAFGAVAMHPVEFLLHQSYLAAIPFFYPIHVGM